jgi:TRAP-type mannitol/chloroaromatic compound transport system permease small subunit
MYGTLFMMGGAYTLSRGGHVRGDFIYRLWQPRTQAKVELVLYFLFFFPGVLALIFAGWRYAARSWRFFEVSVVQPGRHPIYQFKSIIVAAGLLLLIQGIAQVFRCILCIRTNQWMIARDDVEEIEMGLEGRAEDVLKHGTEAVDVVRPQRIDDRDGDRRS